MNLAIDLLLGLSLPALALAVVAGRSLFRSLVMFIVFGVVMALAWARLGAPDLALAEAALGAGLSGALLLASYRRLALRPGPAVPPSLRRRRGRSWLAAPVGLMVAVLVVAVGLAAQGLPGETGAAATPGAAVLPAAERAGAQALERMPQQAVANPVTAVLLLFRGYDTLMEMGVLLAAWLGARAVLGGGVPPPLRSAPAGLPLVGALLSVVVPLSVLVSGYLLHAGGDAPGGAFQGGAVLAAAGVLLVLTGRLQVLAEPPAWQRAVLVLGLAVFSAAGLLAMASGAGFLALPGKAAIYLVETALLLSIALTLVLLFAAGGGLARSPE